MDKEVNFGGFRGRFEGRKERGIVGDGIGADLKDRAGWGPALQLPEGPRESGQSMRNPA